MSGPRVRCVTLPAVHISTARQPSWQSFMSTLWPCAAGTRGFVGGGGGCSVPVREIHSLIFRLMTSRCRGFPGPRLANSGPRGKCYCFLNSTNTHNRKKITLLTQLYFCLFHYCDSACVRPSNHGDNKNHILLYSAG